MEVPLPLDQIHRNYRFATSSTYKQTVPIFENFSLKWRRFRSPFSKFSCSVPNHGLRPRPMPKPSKKVEKVIPKKLDLSSGICEQIEDLVVSRRYGEALEMFEVFECESNCVFKMSTYDALVSACIGLRSIRGVKRVFKHILNADLDLDVYMMNRVLLMHVKCGMMIDAHKLFEEMPEKNLISWNTILTGLVDSGDYFEAFRLFLTLWDEDSDVGARTLATMIRASAGLDIDPGKQLHSCALKLGLCGDVFISCTLIDMYGKCGSIEDSRSVFYAMSEKTTVAWNSIIAGYALHGYSEEALAMYYKMQDSGAKLDHFTYSMIVRVCTRLASLEHAKQAHAGLVRNGFGSDIVANTALVDFYSKWGRIEDARNVFEKMPQKNIISWNALIAGYGSHGRGREAVELFKRMVVREGMAPNHVTFLAVLSACCYSGLSDVGWEIFEAMSRDYEVKPRAMHYACMIELLGREGLLDEAFALIRDAPFAPTINMWAALLTACRIHKNYVLAKYTAEKIYGMEPEKLSNYVMMLNIYNRDGKLEEAAQVLRTLRKRGLRMLPACTWIEVKKQQHVFLSGDKMNPQLKEIYAKLNEVNEEISNRGRVSKEKTLLPDVDEREEEMPLYHSEKIAISYGLVNTPNSTPLQLVQSHRICHSCHDAIKLISVVYNREIVFRDASRFHRFKDGVCSCGDYW